MNLYQLLNEIESGKIAVEHFEYKEAKYSVNFKPRTVTHEDYTFTSMNYREWDETFYIVARDSDNKLEFFRCADGELMKVSVRME